MFTHYENMTLCEFEGDFCYFKLQNALRSPSATVELLVQAT